MSEHSYTTSETKQLHYYHAYGERVILEYHQRVRKLKSKTNRIVELPQKWNKDNLPEDLKTQPVRNIAIIGGGVAGLHAATMLGKHFKVDLYEANKRIGGRLFTHQFDNDSAIGTRVPAGEFDYFDVGAMRFPDTDVMKKTFDLFDDLGIPLIPYRLLGKKTWLAFNEVVHRRDQLPSWHTDPFRVGDGKDDGEDRDGKVPDEYAKRDPAEMLNEAIHPFIEALVDNHQEGLKKLFEHDSHSTRSWLTKFGYPPVVIDYIETMCFGTGGYDRALAETVLEELCFHFNQENPENLKWKCVQGGSQLIPLKMVERLRGPEYSHNVTIFTGHQVTAVRGEYISDDNAILTVSGLRSASTPGGRASFGSEYSHIIFAIPPPCLRTIDLSSCDLDYAQRNALRQVSVGPSCKIGMKFKTAWWNKGGIRGGQSSTDRMARTIVYPSHGDGKSTVLIVSYSWTQDAVALSSLMQGRGTPEEDRLKELMLADLAHVHKNDKGMSIEYLREQFEDMFPWDWTHQPYSMGAFGMFGPSQFQQFYGALTRPAARGHMHFIGETISTTHGWIAGALESAERGVYQLLKLHKLATPSDYPTHNVLDDFKKEWNPVLGVNRRCLKLQIFVSFKLQIEESSVSYGGKGGEKRGGEKRGEEEQGEEEHGESLNINKEQAKSWVTLNQSTIYANARFAIGLSSYQLPLGTGQPQASHTWLVLACFRYPPYVHEKNKITLQDLEREFEAMFPYDWTNHPDSMGAFGVFGPDQFRQYYCALSRPAAGGHMHFVGEAISTIHGWVAGALESATRGAMQVLELNSMALAKSLKQAADAERVVKEAEESAAKAKSFVDASWAVNSGLDCAVKESATVDAKADPLPPFLKKWKGTVGVQPELCAKQLAVSRTMQVCEFGVSPAFKSE